MTAVLAQAIDFGPLESWFVRLVDHPAGGPLGATAAVLACVVIGAAHALAPGHGKAMTAAYLVGDRGRRRDAVALGVIVALMHTASVFVLGLVLLGVTSTPTAGTAAAPWMTMASGMLVTVAGALVARRAWRRRAARARAATGPSPPGHPPGHGPDDEDRDHHLHALPADVSPLSRQGVVLLGVSGGLIPSPSAFLVLATGVFTGRAVFAMALVAAFSVGLAATLIAVGLAVLQGRDALAARAARGGVTARLAALVPLGGGVLLLLGGLALAGASALRILGVI